MRPIHIISVGLAYGATPSLASSLEHRTSSVADTNLLDTLSSAANDQGEWDQGERNALSNLVSQLQQVGSIFTPNTPNEALSDLQHSYGLKGYSNIVDIAWDITAAGLIPPEILSFLNGYTDSELNSLDNQNPAPEDDIYPKSSEDAPYSLSEETLRSAIHIPETFGHGRNGKIPVVLIPGTAIPSGTTWYYSFSKLGDSTDADVVWVNLPRASLNDAQVSAEYVAYAINYISSLCGKPVALISWSQGGLNTQWALKYWPSTRPALQDFIAMSPDFHGTIVEAAICPALTYIACTPSILQQAWESNFITTLRSDDGDSAYVPTTVIYSSFDEIVEPMSGPDASALLGDMRNVGVTLAHIQTVCADQPGGTFYTHEGVLYNPLAWALAIDAITHDGPANISRLNLGQVCGMILAPELDLLDLFGTEGLLLVAAAELVSYKPQAAREPPIAGYASHGGGA
ncbi:lipase B [Penicillium cinerascens]|uniref:Lipase B n=1 Tax=Penicillium cinerascens TaxID=70096 RepID=A0A9W9T015_9EURO|nr:lipase B [Penicillium cinerascens]KAJ5204171.1 lipase B [Penicillium cinerascens]